MSNVKPLQVVSFTESILTFAGMGPVCDCDDPWIMHVSIAGKPTKRYCQTCKDEAAPEISDKEARALIKELAHTLENAQSALGKYQHLSMPGPSGMTGYASAAINYTNNIFKRLAKSREERR